MIKHIVLLAVCCLLLSNASAQLHDKHWYTGSKSDIGFDTSFNYWFGITKFNFSLNDTPVITRDSLGINFDRGNITMSDSAGNVLFYTNGVTFRNAQDQIMQNGDSLGWGWYLKNYDPSRLRMGSRLINASVALPTADKNIYNYLHLFIDSFNKVYTYPRALRWSQVNVSENRLNFKDSTIYEQQSDLMLCATKGNSLNSWWIVTQNMGDNCFYRTFIDSANVISYDKLCNGSYTFPNDVYVAIAFSTDGTKFISAGASLNTTGIQVFDFDRCDGSLKLKESFRLQMLNDSSWASWSIATSPNSRYLYLFCSAAILQFDLEAANIENSMVKVAQWDGFTDYVPVTMYQGQLAIDGKIYVSSGNEVTYIGVIENPDVGGIGCNVKQHSIRVPTSITGLNHFPNYRLGAANCGNVGVAEAAVSKVSLGLYPNPAINEVTAEYNYVNWEGYNTVSIKVTNAIGQVVYEHYLPKYSGLHKVDVSSLPAGVYIATLYGDNRHIGMGRFVKE